MKRFLSIVLLVSAFVLAAAPSRAISKTDKSVKSRSVGVAIASKGKAVSAIVVDANANRTVKFAAKELQNYFHLLTNAQVPIRQSVPGGKISSFVLGTVDSPLVKKFVGKDAAKFKYDGYAVAVKGNTVVIYAATPRGVLNGVHRFIMKHTDFIWVRPLGQQAIYSVNPDLKLNVKSYCDNPVFRIRSWSANSWSREFEVYVSRLCNNHARRPDKKRLNEQLDQAFLLEFGQGHNLTRIWLPLKKYAKTNPEFYMLNNGERRTTGRVQLCYTNRKMWDVFVKESLDIISKLPKHYGRVNMLIEDTPSVCDCAECHKPITLPDGSVLKDTDEAFRSTQYFIFQNYVAEKIYEKYPELEIKVYGYFFTAVPPKVKIFKNIVVSFCPYVRNDKETLHGKSNTKWLARTKKYAEMSPNVIWREYYYCFAKFPRAQANVIAQDLRFISKLGIIMVFPELSWVDNPKRGNSEFSDNDFYTMAGPEFWTINQLYWDPAQDPDELRNEYIKRVCREGAPGIQKFFKILRDSWFLDPTPASFNDTYKRDMGYYVVRKKLVAPCRAALKEAAATVKDPRSKAWIEKLTGIFEKWVKCSDSSIAAEQKVPKAEIKSFPGFDFNSGVWAKAAKLSDFTRMGNSSVKAPEPTEVKVIHNGETLYVGFRCVMPKKSKLVGKSQLTPESFPSGDHAEIFIANPTDGYYHLAFNFHGKKYDAIGTNADWNTKWEVKTQVGKNEWRAVAVIPLKSVKLAIEQNNRVKATFYRCRSGQGKHNVHSSWTGSQVHSVSSFGELVFLHE